MQNNLSNQSPFLSIITVCYNASQTIASTINSVINQSYQNFEYIIVDGGSNDGTLDIINEFGLNRFKLISEPDNGLTSMLFELNIVMDALSGIVIPSNILREP